MAARRFWAFRHQNPEEYKKIARLLDEKRTERLEYIEDFLNALRTELDKYGIRYDVAGRPKHIYSIYKKMVKKSSISTAFTTSAPCVFW